MIKWKRPSGSTITTNEEENTVEHCEAMGWEKLGVIREIIEPVIPEDLKPDSAMPKEPLIDGQTSGVIGEGDPEPEAINGPQKGPKAVKPPKTVASGKL